MQWPRVRFTIGHLMIVVAVAAGLGAWLRLPGARALTVAGLVILAPASIALASPFLFARRGSRLLVAAWVASLWPLSIPWTLNVAWVVAYGFLGHSPGPADNDAVLDLLAGSVMLFGFGSLFSTVICGYLLILPLDDPVVVGTFWNVREIPVLVLPLVWFSVFALLGWDPLGASVWFMD